ncbi:AAA family ATPase [Tupanvirus soda lake]|uniref:AAA family ATPase n=2 Tax=Tupanvirus TaxID=2094720 RepID=A0A6N1P0M1_9VIRU|nr:AAA family ATPase [Tupanvirus soda lake]QKU34771.1 AAA family ATPase [Tupanvirus soda lake]
MDIDKILNVVTSQIPLLVMSINNGTNKTTLLSLFLIPLIIYLIQSIPQLIRYLQREKIPKHYVRYNLDDGSNSNYGPHVNFIDNISVFLNMFHSSSIKSGNIKNYQRLPVNPNIVYRCIGAIISPDNNYFCKFHFGTEIINKIKETGFVFPIDTDLEKLKKYPIFISFDTVMEQIIKNERDGKNVQNIKKDYVCISAFDMKTAEDFINIVVNYKTYKSNNINDFRLIKTMYFYDNKEDYGEINSTVNVNKNYHNVFLTEKNNRTIKNAITEWNKNKIEQLEKGIPNKLGFFLVGNPGCGKSSLIYAIANETKKHIVSINMQDFTNKSFMELMSSIENKVVVFDDIDAYKFAHNRLQMIEQKNDDSNMQQLQLALLASASSNDKSLFNTLNKEMTLDVFLEVLDGYNYLNNCIVILTSNHPELLDPAVTRPGRVDHIINFGLCDEYQFKNIFKYFIKQDYRDVNDSFVFTQNKWSTSYLINTIILPNRNNPQKILRLLSK